MAASHKDLQSPAEVRRRAWPEPVARDVTQAARACFARAGFSDPTLVLRWTEIAGADVARVARPIKLSEGPYGGTLTLQTEAAAALFLGHDSRSLIERINTYLGRQAVTKLRFVQGSVRSLPAPVKIRQPTAITANDPARRWRGPEALGRAILNLARRRGTSGNVD